MESTPLHRGPKRRRDGEGSVYLRKRADGSTIGWAASITVRHPVTQKPVKSIVKYGKTSDLALVRRNFAYAEFVASQGWSDPSLQRRLDEEIRDPELQAQSTTMLELVDMWKKDRLTKVRTGTLAQSTFDAYVGIINSHIGPHLGHLPVKQVTVRVLTKLLNDTLPNTPASLGRVGKARMEERAKHAGMEYEAYLATLPTLGAKTIRSVKNLLSLLFKYAKAQELITSNPVEDLETPRLIHKELDVKAEWGSFLIEHLRSTCPTTQEELRWLLATQLGLRQSEVLGLTDDCFVFDRNGTGKVVVQQVLALDRHLHGCGEKGEARVFPCGEKFAHRCPQKLRTGKYFIDDSTKTSRSKHGGVRIIPLPPALTLIVKAHLKQLKTLRKQASFIPQPYIQKGVDKMGLLIFPTKTGRPITQKSDNAAWHALLHNTNALLGKQNKELIPETLPQHATRHICATYLAKQGTSVEDAKLILGHSTVSAHNVYRHRSQDDLRRIVSQAEYSLRT